MHRRHVSALQDEKLAFPPTAVDLLVLSQVLRPVLWMEVHFHFFPYLLISGGLRNAFRTALRM